ncbi:hypothetical protein SALBM311S_03020 [Streptomyces alboniger]
MNPATPPPPPDPATPPPGKWDRFGVKVTVIGGVIATLGAAVALFFTFFPGVQPEKDSGNDNELAVSSYRIGYDASVTADGLNAATGEKSKILYKEASTFRISLKNASNVDAQVTSINLKFHQIKNLPVCDGGGPGFVYPAYKFAIPMDTKSGVQIDRPIDFKVAAHKIETIGVTVGPEEEGDSATVWVYEFDGWLEYDSGKRVAIPRSVIVTPMNAMDRALSVTARQESNNPDPSCERKMLDFMDQLMQRKGLITSPGFVEFRDNLRLVLG